MNLRDPMSFRAEHIIEVSGIATHRDAPSQPIVLVCSRGPSIYCRHPAFSVVSIAVIAIVGHISSCVVAIAVNTIIVAVTVARESIARLWAAACRERLVPSIPESVISPVHHSLAIILIG